MLPCNRRSDDKMAKEDTDQVFQAMTRLNKESKTNKEES
jgi:hypothetical protein